MTTREEIEAAAERFEGSGGFACSFIEECEDVLFILAQAYITERDERPRRIEAAANEIARQIVADDLPLDVISTDHIRQHVADIITRCLDGEQS